MISYLSGKCVYKDDKRIILDVHGVGYTVFMPEEMSGDIEFMSDYSFWTYLSVRENALELFGFKTKPELNLFELLLSVSGIGPRSAQAIMSIASMDVLERAIVTGDTGYLTKVSGIGRKTAEKIVLELRDKIEAKSGDENQSFQGETDAIDALEALGYKERDAREALKQVDPEVTDTSMRVKAALRFLNGK